MTVSVAELSAMSDDRATELLTECCGASRWVAAMVARRPFESRRAILSEADGAYASLAPSDWLEAFSHHPRIGERMSAVAQGERGSTWSVGEQAGIDRARDDVRDELAAANREYEQRFGYIYIVCATGKTADEMVSLARARLLNEPETELRVAAEEQRKIMHLRLEKLVDNPEKE
ncbi:MAG: 2-oxo-4-hydroxy-4-carboxy-5-ureidoimidazoline decarboxylase [Gemmatimonadaceae bacterium]